jgi:hypothetical protein
VGFEPTIAVLERAKTVHAFDCAVTVTGLILLYFLFAFNLNDLYFTYVLQIVTAGVYEDEAVTQVEI